MQEPKIPMGELHISEIPLTPETSKNHIDVLNKFAFQNLNIVPQIAERLGLQILTSDEYRIVQPIPQRVVIATMRLDNPPTVISYSYISTLNPEKSNKTVNDIIALAKTRIEIEKERNNQAPETVKMEKLLSPEYIQNLRAANYTRLSQPERKDFVQKTTKSLARLVSTEKRDKIKDLATITRIIDRNRINELVDISLETIADEKLQTKIQTDPEDFFLQHLYDLIYITLGEREMSAKQKEEIIKKRLVPDLKSKSRKISENAGGFLKKDHSRIERALQGNGYGEKFASELEALYKLSNNPLVKSQILYFFRDEAYSREISVSNEFLDLLISQMLTPPQNERTDILDGDLEIAIPAVVDKLLMRQVVLSLENKDNVLTRINQIIYSKPTSETVQQRMKILIDNLRSHLISPSSISYKETLKFAKNSEELKEFLINLEKVLNI